MEQNLGQKLLETINRDKADAAAAALRKAERADAQLVAKNAARVAVLNKFMLQVAAEIPKGKVPETKIKDYDMQQWLRTAKKDHNMIVFEAKLRNAGLELVLREEHDGMGMESWIVMTVKPAADVVESNPVVMFPPPPKPLPNHGVYIDLIAMVDDHLDEFPLKWHAFLRRLADRARKNMGDK